MNNSKNHSARNLHVQCSPSHALRPINSYLTPTSELLKQKIHQTNSFVRQNSEPKLFKRTQNINNSQKKRSNEKLYQLSVKKPKRQNSTQSNCRNKSSFRINDIMMALQKVQTNLADGLIKYFQVLKLFYLLKYIRYEKEEEYKTESEREELKKVYKIWISLSKNGICKTINMIIFIFVLEDLIFNPQEIKENLLIIASRSVKSAQNEKKGKENKGKDNPQLIFFIKRKTYLFDEHGIVNLDSEKESIAKIYHSFLSNKDSVTQINKKRERLYSNQQNNLSKESKFTNRFQTCTFQNDLSQFQQSSDQSDKNLKPLSHFKDKRQNFIFDLDNLARPKSKSRNKRSDQVQYQRHTQQFTFHPTIKPYKTDLIPKQNVIKKIKNADKVMYRMKEARTLKEQKQSLVKSGWTNNSVISKLQKNVINVKILDKQKNNKQKVILLKKNAERDILTEITKEVVQKNEEKVTKSFPNVVEIAQKLTNTPVFEQMGKCQEFKIPILYIDVNIEQGKKQRIIIYEGDKANQLAQSFGKRHKLDQQTISRLEEMLKQQINSVLSRIDEEFDEESSILC